MEIIMDKCPRSVCREKENWTDPSVLTSQTIIPFLGSESSGHKAQHRLNAMQTSNHFILLNQRVRMICWDLPSHCCHRKVCRCLHRPGVFHRPGTTTSKVEAGASIGLINIISVMEDLRNTKMQRSILL